MSSYVADIAAGVICIFLIYGIPKLVIYNAAIKECEKLLPCNQTCKVVAVPDIEKNINDN